MDNCCQDKSGALEGLRERQSKVLWIVLGINGTMFCLELIIGLLAGIELRRPKLQSAESSISKRASVSEFCTLGTCSATVCHCESL